MLANRQEKYVHKLFEVSILLKALTGVLDIVGGTLLFFTGTVTSLIGFLTRQELVEDPHDFLAHYLQSLIPMLANHEQFFGAFYLLIHGAIRVLLVIGLWRNKMWAYPASVVVLVTFVCYQVYRFTFTHSVALVFLTAFDLFVIWLIVHEYRHKTYVASR